MVDAYMEVPPDCLHLLPHQTSRYFTLSATQRSVCLCVFDDSGVCVCVFDDRGVCSAAEPESPVGV